MNSNLILNNAEIRTSENDCISGD